MTLGQDGVSHNIPQMLEQQYVFSRYTAAEPVVGAQRMGPWTRLGSRATSYRCSDNSVPLDDILPPDLLSWLRDVGLGD